MKKIVTKVAALVKSAWANYPARCVSYVVTVVVFVAAKAGVVLPVESVTHAVAVALPVLISGELTHRNVSPAK